jgi:hypothetical protein
MADIAKPGSVFIARSEFDAFLFAPVGEDANARELSVLSALARIDVDPWLEAASLARLPLQAATDRLASLLALAPAGLAQDTDPDVIARRVIALLPRKGGLKIAPHSPAGPGSAKRDAIRNDGPINPRAFALYAVIIAAIIGIQWILSTSAPQQANDARAPAIGQASPGSGPDPTH